jgi:glycosyltransferase involved in cell wall biosynthesis
LLINGASNVSTTTAGIKPWNTAIFPALAARPAAKAGKAAPKISIVIPVYNRAAEIDQVLHSVYRQDYANFEVVVYDDCSTDGTVDVAKMYPCHVLEGLHKRVGPTHGRNVAAAYTTGDILFFLDSDALLPRGALAQAERLLREKHCGAVIGVFSRKIRHRDFASNYKNLYMHYIFKTLPEYANAFIGAVAAVRKDVFEAIGGFDVNYGAIPCEDLEIADRLAPHRIHVCPDLQVEHLKKYTLRQVLRDGFERSKSVAKRLLRKRYLGTDKPVCSASRGYVLGVGLTGVGAAAALLGVYLARPLLLAAVAAYAGILYLNRDFLRFLRREQGARFALKSAGFMVVDMFAMGLGVTVGVLEYLRGNKY